VAQESHKHRNLERKDLYIMMLQNKIAPHETEIWVGQQMWALT